MTAPSIPPRNLKPRSILVIEDSTTYVAALRSVLTTLGMSMAVTSTLKDGLAQLAKPHDFDVVILDLCLPDSEGIETLEALLAACDIPVVVITSMADRMTATQAILTGADEYLVKGPLDGMLLAQTLSHTIERHRFRSKLKTMAERLAEQNEKLADLDRQKNAMLGMAAHDIRNPLGVILAYAKFLKADASACLRPEHEAFLDAICETSQFVLNLVEDLLDISTIESGRLSIQKTTTDLAALVRNHIKLIEVLARQKGIDLQAQGPEEGVFTEVDPRKIEQVLGNLLGNAIKFCPAGTPVTVRVERVGDEVHLSVADRGPGIPSKELPKLFQPFSTTTIRPTDGSKSTGLGLAISRRIVEGHGGRIEVESQLGQGTTFRIRLP